MSRLWRWMFGKGDSSVQHPEGTDVPLVDKPDIEKGPNAPTPDAHILPGNEENEKLCLKIAKRVHYNDLDSLKKIMSGLDQEQQEKIIMTKIDKIKGRGEEKFVSFKQSILCYALEKSDVEMCKYLINIIKNFELFISIRKKDHSFSPLHCAAVNENTDVFEILFKKAKDHFIEEPQKLEEIIDLPSEYGNTLLHFACRYGKPENVQMLLDKGASYHISNNFKEYPIHWAAFGGHVKTVELIFKKYEEVDLKKYDKKLEKKKIEVEKDWKAEGRKYKNDEDRKEKIFLGAKKRIERENISTFGESCFKLEGIHCGVPLLCASQNVKIASEKDAHYQCMCFIMDHQIEADATCRDEDCDTALHFTSRKATPVMLAKVLKANALLGVKNEVGNMPLDWISPETMKQVLDNHLHKIEFDSTKGGVTTKDQYAILFTNLFGHHASGSDIKNILALANSPRHQDLALHPVCQSILAAKWQKMWKYFILKLLFFIPFVVLLSVYPILQGDFEHANDTDTKTKIAEEIQLTWYILYGLLALQVFFGTISVLVLIYPFMIESKTYLSHMNTKRICRVLEFYWTELVWSDWYEYVLWIFAFLFLHEKISAVPVVIVSWFSLFLVCSNHPTILPFRFILVKILFKYVKLFVFAFGLISGFAMGFFLLLQECTDEKGSPCVDGAFQNIYTTALKVPAMMMGEISFEAFSLDHAFPHVYFLFGAFIFLITCCLFNMMNGLAVEITGELMKKSQIFKTVAECDMIYEFEVLLKAITSWITYFGWKEINVLAPLWVERLKASPSSGKCKNLDEILNKDPNSIAIEDLWETNKNEKAKWYWIDRGYEMDRKIIYDANALIELAEKKALEEKCKNTMLYEDPADLESSDEDENGSGDATAIAGQKEILKLPLAKKQSTSEKTSSLQHSDSSTFSE